MPYKDSEQAKEASKERMRKHRQGVTLAGVTLVKRPNGADYNPAETLPDGSLRYMGPFSDGQVLDRLMCKEVKNVKPAPIRRTTIDNGVPSIVNAMVDTNKREVLIDICNQLKLHSTLVMVDGKFKHENCLGMVNYGIGGPDMAAVAEMLEVTA